MPGYKLQSAISTTAAACFAYWMGTLAELSTNLPAHPFRVLVMKFHRSSVQSANFLHTRRDPVCLKRKNISSTAASGTPTAHYNEYSGFTTSELKCIVGFSNVPLSPQIAEEVQKVNGGVRRRTPIACLRRFQATLNTNFVRWSKWTDAEDRLLHAAVKVCHVS